MALPVYAGKILAGGAVVTVGVGGVVLHQTGFFSKKINYQKELNIPATCFNKDGSFKECDISKDNLKAMNFLNKKDEDITTTLSGNIKLKIEETKDTETFKEGVKFVFKNVTEDITIPATDTSKSIKLKKNVETEFKIKKENGKYYLEKAWDAKSLLNKAVKNCTVAGSKCTLQTNSTINLWTSDTDYVINALVSTPANQEITFAEDTESYNQGFKFTFNNQPTLNATDPKTIKPSGNSNPTLTISNNTASYQVLSKSIDGKQEWFLVKKGS